MNTQVIHINAPVRGVVAGKMQVAVIKTGGHHRFPVHDHHLGVHVRPTAVKIGNFHPPAQRLIHQFRQPGGAQIFQHMPVVVGHRKERQLGHIAGEDAHRHPFGVGRRILLHLMVKGDDSIRQRAAGAVRTGRPVPLHNAKQHLILGRQRHLGHGVKRAVGGGREAAVFFRIRGKEQRLIPVAANGQFLTGSQILWLVQRRVHGLFDTVQVRVSAVIGGLGGVINGRALRPRQMQTAVRASHQHRFYCCRRLVHNGRF